MYAIRSYYDGAEVPDVEGRVGLAVIEIGLARNAPPQAKAVSAAIGAQSMTQVPLMKAGKRNNFV